MIYECLATSSGLERENVLHQVLGLEVDARRSAVHIVDPMKGVDRCKLPFESENNLSKFFQCATREAPSKKLALLKR